MEGKSVHMQVWGQTDILKLGLCTGTRNKCETWNDMERVVIHVKKTMGQTGTLNKRNKISADGSVRCQRTVGPALQFHTELQSKMAVFTDWSQKNKTESHCRGIKS